MTRPNPRQKFALQSIALVILGAVFIPIWYLLQKLRVSDVEVSSVIPVSETLSGPLSDLYLFLIISFFAILFAVLCAFYFEEWLRETNWVRRFVESQVGILSSVPSLLYGLLAVSIFLPYSGVFGTVEGLMAAESLDATSLKTGSFQGDTTLFYIAVLTFILLVMPRTIKTTQEALRSVPMPIREAAYALGANRWQVLMEHVVPLARRRILAGGCRAMSCALAAAALFVGICIWSRPVQSGQASGRFMLFLGGALLLSIFSSFLAERHAAVSIRHT
ncbi:MAG: ABC transporter permease subunit [Candidatus Poribacteria bacterium]|nr:ABC transporter permease subunit [Candidatus Poribacteria bacterium]